MRRRPLGAVAVRQAEATLQLYMFMNACINSTIQINICVYVYMHVYMYMCIYVCICELPARAARRRTPSPAGSGTCSLVADKWQFRGIFASTLKLGERGRDNENTSDIEMSVYFTVGCGQMGSTLMGPLQK